MPEIPNQKKDKGVARSRWVAAIIQRRFLVLFLFLLATLIMYPYAESSGSGYVAFRFAGSAVILLSVYAIGFRRGLVIFGLVLAVPALLKHILALRADAGVFSLLSICLSFAFDVFIVVVMFHRVFSREKPNAETIFGALCIYLLIGFSFASVYGMVATIQPHAFYLNPITNSHAIPDRFDFIYYSFATMTALGASGINAISNQARSLTVMESILGVLYLAVLIARLMGTYRGYPVPKADAP